MAENEKDYETVRDILTYAGVTGGLSRSHEADAKKALDRILQNREWEVIRARNQERDECAKAARDSLLKVERDHREMAERFRDSPRPGDMQAARRCDQRADEAERNAKTVEDAIRARGRAGA